MVEQGFCKAQVAGSNPVGGFGIKKSMIINLWHNKDMDRWRWTLTDPQTMEQHAGGQKDLRDAMNDVANTVEYVVKHRQK